MNHTLTELRRSFLNFFKEEGHREVRSSSLIPANDPTLLFTNAGMVQFKDVFLGQEARDYVKAVSAQKCVRAGGKHNDLDNVGYTARHHTFFEMLGNFSFGDYFKEEAIRLAWKYLTEVLKIPQEKLWITVYKDDQEAEAIWLEKIGVSPLRFSRCGDADNFWQMGETGPCGPCSEIFYDHGDSVEGGPPGSPEADGDRYIEIWNLVFMQYERAPDGSLKALPKPSVDTGMGLERLAAVMQDVHSNYEIDLFESLITQVAKVTGNETLGPSHRVIADHIRSIAFLIADGVTPSNEGRGYVLRRIMRRALRHSLKLGSKQPVLVDIFRSLQKGMADAYPELLEKEQVICDALLREENQFSEILRQGMVILEDALLFLKDRVIPGDLVFRLYDTYGFPMDLTADIARERGLTIDVTGFEKLMSKQREMARGSSKFGVSKSLPQEAQIKSEFLGYELYQNQGQIAFLMNDYSTVKELKNGSEGQVIAKATCFYAESGGQVGDTGFITTDSGVFTVTDTVRFGDTIVHEGHVKKGTIQSGQLANYHIDEPRRQAIINNHSATHLLHAVLRNTLGESVMQKGSLVAADRLRFDFSYPQALTKDELRSIEEKVNALIWENKTASAAEMTMEEAIQKGALAFFGDKYGDKVRVMSMGASQELCGGTHVKRTGDIGFFKILSECGIASGVRRIEALTSFAALKQMQQESSLIDELKGSLNAKLEELTDKIEALKNSVKEKDKMILKQQSEVLFSNMDSFLKNGFEVNGVSCVITEIESDDVKSLRELADKITDKLSGVVILIGKGQGKHTIMASVPKALSAKYPANLLLQKVAEILDGKGGGKPQFAQGSVNNLDKIADLKSIVSDWVQSR